MSSLTSPIYKKEKFDPKNQYGNGYEGYRVISIPASYSERYGFGEYIPRGYKPISISFRNVASDHIFVLLKRKFLGIF